MPPRFQNTRPVSERKQDRDEIGRKQLEKMQQAKMMPQPDAHSESNDQHDAEQKMNSSYPGWGACSPGDSCGAPGAAAEPKIASILRVVTLEC